MKKLTYSAYDLWKKTPATHETAAQAPLEKGDKDGMVWGKDMGSYETMLPNVKVNPHSVRVFKLVPEDENTKHDAKRVCDEL